MDRSCALRTIYQYDYANQMQYSSEPTGRTTYTYDLNGNLPLSLDPSLLRTTTTWDYENKTKTVVLPSAIRNTMVYEPGGLRVKLEDSAGTTKFIYDGQAYLLETNGSNITQATYTNEPVSYGRIISQRRSESTSYHHPDALGSTRNLTNSSETVTDTYLYDAWGNQISATGTTRNPFRWIGNVGYYYDPDTANYYIRARIYYPKAGRWSSVDPLGFVDGMNLYGYVGCMALTLDDASGTITVKPIQENLDNLTCRSRAWIGWDFILDKPAPCKGWLVQSVSYYCEVGKCFKMTSKQEFVYWEAWPVPKGAQVSAQRSNNNTITDIAAGPSPERIARTHGVLDQNGEIRFYCEDSRNGVPGTSNLKDKWKDGRGKAMGTGRCAISAGILPRTLKKPHFWKHEPIEGTAKRSFSFQWDCCPCGQDRNYELVSANAEPRLETQLNER